MHANVVCVLSVDEVDIFGFALQHETFELQVVMLSC